MAHLSRLPHGPPYSSSKAGRRILFILFASVHAAGTSGHKRDPPSHCELRRGGRCSKSSISFRCRSPEVQDPRFKVQGPTCIGWQAGTLSIARADGGEPFGQPRESTRSSLLAGTQNTEDRIAEHPEIPDTAGRPLENNRNPGPGHFGHLTPGPLRGRRVLEDVGAWSAAQPFTRAPYRRSASTALARVLGGRRAGRK
jgi:hypothetical protein